MGKPSDLFVRIGAIVGIILAILGIFLPVGAFSWGFGLGWIWNLIVAIIVILLCLGLLQVLFKIPSTGIVLLILGLVIFILGGNWGGLILIIAAILVFLGK